MTDPRSPAESLRRRTKQRTQRRVKFTLKCARAECRGFMVGTGACSRKGMGPTICQHICDMCGAQEFLKLPDFFPRIEDVDA